MAKCSITYDIPFILIPLLDTILGFADFLQKISMNRIASGKTPIFWVSYHIRMPFLCNALVPFSYVLYAQFFPEAVHGDFLNLFIRKVDFY